MHIVRRALVILSFCLGLSSVAHAEAPVSLDGLSLDLLPVANVTPETADKPMVIFLTGDGGWAELDRRVSARLVKHGMPVVGWSTLTYFWRLKTPEQTTQDLTRILRYYAKTWHRNKVILAGYSFGAEIIPFVVNRLAPEDRKMIVGTALLVPSTTSSFEIHMSDWIKITKKGEYDVQAEIHKMTDIPTLCLYSKEDDDDDVGVMLCPLLTSQSNIHVEDRTGGHNFDKHYRMISDLIEQTLRQEIEPPKSADVPPAPSATPAQ